MYNGTAAPPITIWGTAPYDMKGFIGGERYIIEGACDPLAKGKAADAVEGPACNINCDRWKRKCQLVLI